MALIENTDYVMMMGHSQRHYIIEVRKDDRSLDG